MTDYQNSKIWKKSLAEQGANDQQKACREKFRISFENFRLRAATLAAEIPQELKEFTVHDVSHLDSLWEMIDIITEEDYYLNPAECYVLGGAILVHDLGLALAAYPNGLDELKRDAYWSDTIVFLYREECQRDPTKEEILNPDPYIEKMATKILLRHFHAKHAEYLAMIHWKGKNQIDDVYYLIEDSALRETYGRIIGLLASSHWWAVDDLTNKLSEKVGAASFVPTNWDIDLIKLACLLRIADAIHLDDRRAPTFLWSIRDLSEESNQHWKFQNRLLKPLLTPGGRLLFTSKSPFDLADINSWWLCYDTLKAVDLELSSVDALLSESGRQKLLAYGVVGIDNPQKLSKYIHTNGWEPVDTQIRIENVSRLVQRLGGVELYGEDMLVPLRELIQNSSDSIRARKLIESHQPNWGDIFISEGRDNFGNFIIIEDNGTGMSPKVLTGPLLNFGQSIWHSKMLQSEFPGLQTKKYRSVGKYGIGFFSIFMWGDKVTVTSRKYNESYDETWCLEFEGGLKHRPLLRRAREDERLVNAGTKVQVWFRDDMNLVKCIDFEGANLAELCKFVAPGIDANLTVSKIEKSKRIIAANDWRSMKTSELNRRVYWPTQSGYYHSSDEKNLGKMIDIIYNDAGEIIGRGFISWMYNYPGFAVTSFGLRTQMNFRDQNENSGTFHGLVEGESINAARNKSKIRLTQSELNNWATSQAKKIDKLKIFPREKLWYALSVISLGGSPENLPFAARRTNRNIRFLNYSSIVKKFKSERYCIIRDVDFFDFKINEFENYSFGIQIDSFNYRNQKILDQIEPYEYGRCHSRNTGSFWVEKALMEAWNVDKLNIQYFDGDEYDSQNNITKLTRELNSLGIKKKFKKADFPDQNYIAIVKRVENR